MTHEFHAIYENGVLRPLTPLNLPDLAEVAVTLREANGAGQPSAIELQQQQAALNAMFCAADKLPQASRTDGLSGRDHDQDLVWVHEVIFVDTGAWFARYVTDDVDHLAAANWFAKVPDRLITTDYVVDELLTLLKVRGYPQIAFSIGAPLLAGVACQIEFVQPADIHAAWTPFSTFRDKGWSFTDCTSRVVIERLGIKTAAAFDDHFRQFGTITVVP